MRRIETYEWWPELVLHKDELSLRELAERFDVTPGAISAAFKRIGLSRKAAPPGPRSRRRGSEEGLPPEPGEELAGATDVRPGSKDAKILPFADQLGQVPDSDVAVRAGVSVRTIASYRARNGVGGYKGPRRRSDAPSRRSGGEAIADTAGPERVASASTPAPAPAVVANGAHGGAWRVVTAQSPGSARVVVADSLVDAAARAEAAGLGRVLTLEWIGEVV